MIACHTPEQTELYERGYPYMTILVDGHKDDKKPALAATKVFSEYYGRYHAYWPKLVAHAFARASGVGGDGEWDTDEVKKAASSTALVSADEARALARSQLTRVSSASLYEVFHALFTLEAIAGTDVILEALVDGLEALPKKRWKASDDDETPALVAYATGFMLLRSMKAQAFKKRLEALYEETVKATSAVGEETIRGGLDLALHGTDGAKRTLGSSHWQYWYYYLMVDDAAVHLTRLANNAKSDWVPEARIVYLAGPEMFPVYTTQKALRQGKRLPHILGDFGMFADDHVLSLMVDMIGVKGAGDAPAEYFKTNGKYVRKKLEALAKGSGAAAVKAKAALNMLP